MAHFYSLFDHWDDDELSKRASSFSFYTALSQTAFLAEIKERKRETRLPCNPFSSSSSSNAIVIRVQKTFLFIHTFTCVPFVCEFNPINWPTFETNDLLQEKLLPSAKFGSQTAKTAREELHGRRGEENLRIRFSDVQVQTHSKLAGYQLCSHLVTLLCKQ